MWLVKVHNVEGDATAEGMAREGLDLTARLCVAG
jgi:hypothetical protein